MWGSRMNPAFAPPPDYTRREAEAVTTRRLAKGETVRIRALNSDSDWCPATVIVVSTNGVSVGLLLHGAVRAAGGMATGTLPLFIDYERETVTGLLGEEYEIEVREALT